MLSIESPYLRVRWPIPPPRVIPTPVVEMIPLGAAMPNACVAWSTSPITQPPRDLVRSPRSGSTRTPLIADRSITSPSSTLPRPGPLCPPHRIAVSRPFSRPKFTAAITSATSTQRTISSGRLSIIAL